MPLPSIRLTSDYLVPGIPGGHRVSLTLSPLLAPSTGHLSIDPNVCTLDDFGEPQMCTLMASIPRPIKLEKLKEDTSQSLYAIVFTAPWGTPPRMRLVVLEHPMAPLQCPARLLVYDDADHLAHIVHLHRVAAIELPLPVIPIQGGASS